MSTPCYVLNDMTFAVTSEANGRYVLSVYTPMAFPLPTAHLSIAKLVPPGGKSPNITIDLFKLRVVI